MNYREGSGQKLFVLFFNTGRPTDIYAPRTGFPFGWSGSPQYCWPRRNDLLYALFVKVMQTNSYASRTIEIQEGQKVISTGPYALVRHPMYTAALVIYARHLSCSAPFYRTYRYPC